MALTNDSLVDIVASKGYYLDSSRRSRQVLEAMRKVDRRNFIPGGEEAVFTTISAEAYQQLNQSLECITSSKPASMENVRKIVLGACQVNASTSTLKVLQKDLAYNDEVLSIGYGQTCSQPSMVAFMTDVLELKPGMKVLEIGTGCGYHAAITSELVGKEGKVYSLELLPELAELAHFNLENQFGSDYQSRVTIINTDGSAGLPEKAPFDVIYLTAGVQLSQFEPGLLAAQLKLPGGMLLYPEEDGLLIKEVYGKYGNIRDLQLYQPVCFVPLKGKNAEGKEEVISLKAAQ